MNQYITFSYADLKAMTAQFTGGKVFFYSAAGTFKIWAMASGFAPVLVVLTAPPGTFNTDFPSATQLSAPLSTGDS